MIDAGRVLVDSDPVEPLKPQFDQGRQGLMSVAANFDALRNTIRRLKGCFLLIVWVIRFDRYPRAH
jgi:hypothetical protein